MSSLPEENVTAKVESPIPFSQQGLSQVSETLAGSQISQAASIPSQTSSHVSQEIKPISDSITSSTMQDDASQSQQPSQLFSQVAPSNTSADTDASMMPPPTPTGLSQGATSGLARSSGRAIKPTLKLRGDGEDSFTQRTASGSSSSQGILTGAQNYGFRNRKQSVQSSNGNSRAPRLKLNLKGGHASRGKGDPTLTGVDKTIPYMRGYDRELDSSDDEAGEGMAFEEQLILRMPEGHEATKVLGDWIRKREVGNDGREVEVKFKDSRRALFKVGDKQFSSKLVDLPAIIESHKTLDNKQVFKIADISQMLLVTHQIKEESEVIRGDGLDKVEGLTDDFIYDHGITPPMKWARKRRFRQRIHKRTIETVEKEVERLLAEDERAENVEYAMIDMAEVDRSDSDEEGGGDMRLRRGHGDRGSPIGSQADTTSNALDGASVISDMEDNFSQMGDQEESGMGMEDDDVDQDLQRELEQEMLLQQQEDEEDEDEDGSTRNSMRGRSMSRATSEDDDDEDDEEEDDLFDAGDEDEGVTGQDAEERDDEADDDDDDDDDLDEEEQEQRVRETQLEAECKEIEIMVKRKGNEVEATMNALIKQRNLQTLKRMQTELDMKRSQLLDLRQQRREGKEAAKAEAQAQAEASAAAAAAVASNRTSSSATPSTAAITTSTTAVTSGANAAITSLTGNAQEVVTSTERDKGQSAAAKEVTTAAATSRKPMTAQIDKELEDAGAEDDEEEDDDEGSDESDLFG